MAEQRMHDGTSYGQWLRAERRDLETARAAYASLKRLADAARLNGEDAAADRLDEAARAVRLALNPGE